MDYNISKNLINKQSYKLKQHKIKLHIKIWKERN